MIKLSMINFLLEFSPILLEYHTTLTWPNNFDVTLNECIAKF